MKLNWQPLWDIINSHDSFILSSHVRPDADALWSELALKTMLEDLGKRVQIANPSAPPNTLQFLDPDGLAAKLGVDVSVDALAEFAVHIVLDTSAWVQLGGVGDVLRNLPTTKVVIDHHVSSNDLRAIEFRDTAAEATGALIYRFARAFDLKISPQTAMQLFCAIATDTGWFRFPSTTGDTMRIIGDLVDLGAEPHTIYEMLYERRSLSRVRLSGVVLQRTQVGCDGKLAYTTVQRTDFKETGATPVDTEDLVNECLRISGTQIAFILVEQEHGGIKVSLRSRKGSNVAAIAEQFGGGGHKQASGATLPGPINRAAEVVLQAVTAALEQPC